MHEHIERIRRDGYTIVEGALDPAVMERVRAELTPWLQGNHPGRNDFEGSTAPPN